MKNQNSFKLMLLTFFTLTGLTIASGCKKDKTEPKISNELVGLWMDSPSRVIEFKDNGEFTMRIIAEGYTTFFGNYTVKGDSLKVKVLSQETRNGSAAGVKTDITDYDLYEKGIFKVKGDTLKLKYISYPADAPVETEANFTKTYRID